MKSGAAYIVSFTLLLFAKQATAQPRNSLLQQLTATVWEAPFFYEHIDYDTLTLHKADPKKSYPRTKAIRFTASGEIKADWYFKNIEYGCSMGLLWIDSDSSHYILKGDTLQATIKGGYVSEEEFNFKRDYLVKRINGKEIQLLLIKNYFGEPCRQLTNYRLYQTETAIAPPHPNTRKKQ